MRGRRITVIILPCQGKDGGSIPLARSNKMLSETNYYFIRFL